MIACGFLFFRADQFLKLSGSYTSSLNPSGYFQGYRPYRVSKPNKVRMADRNNNRKTEESRNKAPAAPISHVWRPITTQASSYGGSTLSSSSGSVGSNQSSVSKGKSVVSTKKHSVSVMVGASLIRFIVGKGGATQKQIEEEFGVTIVLPSSRKEDSVVIEGGSADSVSKANARIQAIIAQAVNRPSLDYSHFVSLPLAIYPELVDKLFMFQNSVLGSGDQSSLSSVGIEKSMFINPKTFHLTVLMLKLWNKDRVDTSTKVLKDISSQIMDVLDNRPISIRLRGLDCMKGSIDKARVVYLPVEEIGGEGRLARACPSLEVIIDAYVRAGLVLEKDATHSLKLHATVMNARHRKRTMGEQTEDSFDARSIFNKYGSTDWGTYVVREAHLSQKFSYDDKGYYHCCASIPFP